MRRAVANQERVFDLENRSREKRLYLLFVNDMNDYGWNVSGKF